MSKPKSKTTSLAVISPVTSAPDILSLLKTELSGLQAISTTQYKTTGKVEGFSNNIENETKIENLVRMWSSISGKAKSYTEAQMDLGVTTCPVYKMNDSLPEDYKHDIQLRIKILTHAERKAELEALMKEAEAFLTKEDQFTMLQQRVAAAFNK